MKKIFIMVLVAIFFSVPAFADNWCKWVEGEAVDCLSDRKGVIMANNFPTRGAARANAKGWFKIIVTQPTYNSETHIRDAEQWAFVNNEITKTWSVRELTDPEKDQRLASPMNEDVYQIWKMLHGGNIFTIEQIRAHLSQEQQDAYEARNRLENP